MPISSSARVSEASLKRLGGCVVWLFASIPCDLSGWPTVTTGNTASRSAKVGVWVVGALDIRPQIAGKLDRLAACLETALRRPRCRL